MKTNRRTSVGRPVVDLLKALALSLVIVLPGCDSADTNEPQGRIVYGERVDMSFQIFIMNADGTGRTQLTRTGDNLLPRWSPDGTRIIYGANKAGDWNIYIRLPRTDRMRNSLWPSVRTMIFRRYPCPPGLRTGRR